MSCKCLVCGASLSRYNDTRLCFACQKKGRDAEQNPVLMTSRHIQLRPHVPVVIQVHGSINFNPRKQIIAAKIPYVIV
jgi:hypothetical protein